MVNRERVIIVYLMYFMKKKYDYLISIDGDDFLYPYALHQLEKCLKKKVI